MAYMSLTDRAKDVVSHIQNVISTQDIAASSRAEQDLVSTIKHQATDARLAVREYEYAESRDDQLKAAKEAKQFLDGLRQNIVAASQYNIFGATDVAQISAQLQTLEEQLT